MNWDPALYAHAAGFVPGFGRALIELLDVAPPARLLDVGCGDGVLSTQLVERGYSVTGIDASAEMVEAARARGIEAYELDVADGLAALDHAAREAFARPFDVALSNATLHWVRDAHAALTTVRSALAPGARFVAEFGGEGNVRSIRHAFGVALGRRGIDARAHDPWTFPSVARYASALEACGFRVDFITRFERPTELPGHARDWLRTFTHSFLAAVPAAERPALIEEVCGTLVETQRDAGGRWTLDYVRLRFVATAA
jgi:trans-aconitate methyltransferase